MRRACLFFIAVALAACGGEEGIKAVESDSAEQQPVQSDVETIVKKAGVEDVTVKIYAVGEEIKDMTFEPDRIQVLPGANVNLIFMNKARSEGMVHNVVFIIPGEQKRVTEAGLEAGPELHYVRKSDNVIAHTALAGPGQQVETSFTAPSKAGTYQYICTYPGHTSKKGILIVRN